MWSVSEGEGSVCSLLDRDDADNHVATDVEGIFRLAGSAKRIKDLQTVFNSPDRYGKGLDWTGYTVHDAANILRRYLNQLPEPIVPLDFYERFRQPLRPYQSRQQENGQPHEIDMSMDQHGKAVLSYQKLITELPPLNRQLLLYILDLLAVFASKSDLNRMTAANLAAIFQPGIISHPQHDMSPNEYRLSQDVLIFLIENQDHFLIGMSGTGMDEKTAKDVQSGAIGARSPKPASVGRSTSNASAGADSLRKTGVRRNASLHSHNSRGGSSPGVSNPGTPTGHGSFGSASGAAGVARSNTVPSKRSPAITGGRFQRKQESSPVGSPIVEPPTPDVPTPVANVDNPQSERHDSAAAGLASTDIRAPPQLQTSATSPITTNAPGQQPGRDRKISNLFARSPALSPTDASGRQPKKLQKRRIPGSANDSAHSSQASFQADDHPSAFHTPLISPELSSATRTDPLNPSTPYPPFEQQQPSSTEKTTSSTPSRQANLQPPRSPVASLHSGTSATDHSEFDTLDNVGPTSQPQQGEEKEKKRNRWRFSSSAKKTDDYPLQPPPRVGENVGARGSNSSIGSGLGIGGGARPRKSFTGDSQTTGASYADASSTSGSHGALLGQISHDSDEKQRDPLRDQSNSTSTGDDKKGLFGKWKAKMSERREEKERAKSPPPRSQPGITQEEQKSKTSLSAFAQEHFSPRGRSFDKQRSNPSELSSGSGQSQAQHMPGPPTSGEVKEATPTNAAVNATGGVPLETVNERPTTEAREKDVLTGMEAVPQTHPEETVVEEPEGKQLSDDSNAAQMAGNTLTAEMERGSGAGDINVGEQKLREEEQRAGGMMGETAEQQ